MKISFRGQKIGLFYIFYLNKYNQNEFNHQLLNQKIYNFSISDIEKIEDIFKNLSFLEKEITNSLSILKWKELKPIEKSLLINGLYEIEFLKIGKKIVINEYVNLAKSFGTTDQSYKLINAVLDNSKIETTLEMENL